MGDSRKRQRPCLCRVATPAGCVRRPILGTAGTLQCGLGCPPSDRIAVLTLLLDEFSRPTSFELERLTSVVIGKIRTPLTSKTALGVAENGGGSCEKRLGLLM